MLTIIDNEERIDETIEEITMTKNCMMHLNFVNAARHYTADSFIKVRTPMDVAYTVNILNDFWGEEMTMQFIAMFNKPQKELSFDADDYEESMYWEEERNRDCNGVGDECLERFNDFCASFKMLDLSTGLGRNETMLCIQFINKNRDILIDDESDDKRYIGRFTTIKDEGRWFTLTDELKAYQTKGEEE